MPLIVVTLHYVIGYAQKLVPMLVTAEGQLPRARAIMHYLSGLAGHLELTGATLSAQAMVDNWIEFAAFELDPRVQAFEIAKKSKSQDNAKEIAAQITQVLEVLESHLAGRTYLVGHHFTLADLAVAMSVQSLFETVISPEVRYSKLVQTFRWFMTAINQPAVHAVVGTVTLYGDNTGTPKAGGAAAALGGKKSKAPPAAATAPAAAATGAGTIPAGVPQLANVHTGTVALPNAAFTRRRERIADVLARGKAAIGSTVTAGGWARTVRASGKSMAFIALSDGSCFETLQVVIEDSRCPDLEAVNAAGGTGACFLVTGTVVESPGKGQEIDLDAVSVKVLGTNAAAEYPLAKARISLEKLRTLQHLRPRSNMFGAVTRVRNALSAATHRFYQERGFLYIHTPLISTSDCEGAGEQFGVTTLLPEDPTKDLPRTKSGAIDYKKDFFGRQASLTVSGQLQVEAFACAMSDVYTFGPTFRAEDSHTSRHLAEFWMIEPEIAFAGLQEDMDLAEDFVKYCTQYVLQFCAVDIEFFDKFVEKGLVSRLQNVVDSGFARISYTEAIQKLTEPSLLKKAKFTEKPYWGIDLGSEHERYLTEKVFKRPTIIYNYPKGIKAFYMRVNEDDKTVAALDVLVPKIGELVGGSVREEREDVLKARMTEAGVEPESMEWYTQLRKYGTVPHAGFGVGFERLVMYVTGVENIRDVIPFPRYPGHADI